LVADPGSGRPVCWPSQVVSDPDRCRLGPGPDRAATDTRSGPWRRVSRGDARSGGASGNRADAPCLWSLPRGWPGRPSSSGSPLHGIELHAFSAAAATRGVPIRAV